MIKKTPVEKLVVYIRRPEGEEELIDEHDLNPKESLGDALLEMSLGQRTPVDGARFLLNMRDIKGNDRRRLRAMVESEACKHCLFENKGKCAEGHTEEWVKKILA